VRTVSSKLICDYKKNVFELYDLLSDADEKNNLWPGDDYEEKSVLISELEAFSRIDSDIESAYAED
jgi:hypothetical protein